MKLNTIHIDVPDSHPPHRGKVVIIYTGGTFGMHYNRDGILVPFDFSRILAQLPTIRKLELALTVVAFDTPIDSSDVSPQDWAVMAGIIQEHYNGADGFVILHGTDTMAYTASALSFMLEGLSKSVVLTGAQLPISEPRSDARENLITALQIASEKREGRSRVPEVCIYFDYELLRGNRTRKVQSMQFDAFDSGNYPALAKAGVTIDYNDAVIRQPDVAAELRVRTGFDAHIAILKVFPGLTESVVHSTLESPGLKAIILETYGSGNVPGVPWLYDRLEAAVQKGLVLVNVSQCPRGAVVQGRYETSKRLLEIGVIGGGDLTTEAAVPKLMLLLGEYGPGGAREGIAKPLAGELTVDDAMV